jgi:hypothetical protein
MKVKCVSEPPTHSNSFRVGIDYSVHVAYLANRSPFFYVEDRLGNKYSVPSNYFKLIKEIRKDKIHKIYH